MNDISYQIRYATMDDCSDISRLSGELGYPACSNDIKHRLESVLSSKDHAIYVAQLSGGRIIGWIHTYKALSVESGAFAVIAGLIVSKAFRGKGVGTQLLGAVEQWTKQMDLPKLRVRSQLHRDDAKQFYSSMGFSVTKQQRVFDKPIQNENSKY